MLTPSPATSATVTPGLAEPSRHTNHRASATAIPESCVSTMIRFRGKRSANFPPMGPRRSAGMNWANEPNPTHAGEPVACSNTNGTVTFCIHVPV